jgi:hypothetical protein
MNDAGLGLVAVAVDVAVDVVDVVVDVVAVVDALDETDNVMPQAVGVVVTCSSELGCCCGGGSGGDSDSGGASRPLGSAIAENYPLYCF